MVDNLSNSSVPASPPSLTNRQVNAASLIFILYILFAAMVVGFAFRADDANWARILVVFSSVESIGFAAAGVLIGQRVNADARRQLTEAQVETRELNASLRQVEAQAAERSERHSATAKAVLALLETDEVGAPESLTESSLSVRSGPSPNKKRAIAMLRETMD